MYIKYRLEFDLLFEKASWKVPAISFKECTPKEMDCFQLFNPHNRYRESTVFFFGGDIHVPVFLLPGVRG